MLEGFPTRGVLVAAACVAALACGEPQPNEFGPAFTELHAEHARSPSVRDVKDRIVASLFDEPPPATGLAGQALRAELVDRLNMGFLLDGLDAGYRDRVSVALGLPVDHGGVLGYDLRVDDPALPAPIEAVVLTRADTPLSLDTGGDLVHTDGAPPRAAVLGLHGHFQSVDDFRRDGYGQELAEQGYVVVILAFIEMDCGAAESSLTEHLLNRGFALMAVRAYKGLALLELLASWTATDAARLGIIAHSGGSSTSWVIARITDRLRARVWDYEQSFNDLCGGRIHCETDPNVFEIAGDVFARDTLEAATLEVPYEYLGASDRERIRAFFAAELTP